MNAIARIVVLLVLLLVGGVSAVALRRDTFGGNRRESRKEQRLRAIADRMGVDTVQSTPLDPNAKTEVQSCESPDPMASHANQQQYCATQLTKAKGAQTRVELRRSAKASADVRDKISKQPTIGASNSSASKNAEQDSLIQAMRARLAQNTAAIAGLK